MASLTFEQIHDLETAPLFCQYKNLLYSVFFPHIPISFSGGQNTEFSQYIEEDIIIDMI